MDWGQRWKGAAEFLNGAVDKTAKEVTDEDYKSFYFSVAAAYDTPFATLHNRTEGTVEFTNLLFIPSVHRLTYSTQNAGRTYIYT